MMPAFFVYARSNERSNPFLSASQMWIRYTKEAHDEPVSFSFGCFLAVRHVSNKKK